MFNLELNMFCIFQTFECQSFMNLFDFTCRAIFNVITNIIFNSPTFFDQNQIIGLFEILTILNPKEMLLLFGGFQILCLSKKQLDNLVFFELKFLRENVVSILINLNSYKLFSIFKEFSLDQSITQQILNYLSKNILNEISQYFSLSIDNNRLSFFNFQNAIYSDLNIDDQSELTIYRSQKVIRFSLLSMSESVENKHHSNLKLDPFLEIVFIIMKLQTTITKVSQQYFNIIMEEDNLSKIYYLRKLIVQIHSFYDSVIKNKIEKFNIESVLKKSFLFFKLNKEVKKFINQRNIILDSLFKIIDLVLFSFIKSIRKEKIEEISNEEKEKLHELINELFKINIESSIVKKNDDDVLKLMISRLFYVILIKKEY